MEGKIALCRKFVLKGGGGGGSDSEQGVTVRQYGLHTK